ncbi:hypothetical protein CC78DRAFT_576842 [Lojkania enalia]|uniref:Uncharacterized protein n=1 Tax=Lojkania enalia TaxID=147567 RepID=A0A9P4KJ40_9PLEO|nr:hypothetical protein CC78DRAFT_576842 [Didymosphaeria enalia]
MASTESTLKGQVAEEPTSKYKSRTVIENIRLNKGFLSKATHEQIITNRFYSSRFCFLNGAIQNADDLRYTQENVLGYKRVLGFTLLPDCLIIETNEDNFTRANMGSICAAGRRSQKSNETRNNIGEKGPLFDCDNEENRFGIVISLDSDFIGIFLGMTTRFTLSVSDYNDSAYEKSGDEVCRLPDSVLLYLEQLEYIRFSIFLLNGSEQNIEIKKASAGQMSITLISLLKGPSAMSLKDLLEDFRSPHRKEAVVEFAFPEDPKSKTPILSKHGQRVFAYLPLSRRSKPQVGTTRVDKVEQNSYEHYVSNLFLNFCFLSVYWTSDLSFQYNLTLPPLLAERMKIITPGTRLF